MSRALACAAPSRIGWGCLGEQCRARPGLTPAVSLPSRLASGSSRPGSETPLSYRHGVLGRLVGAPLDPPSCITGPSPEPHRSDGGPHTGNTASPRDVAAFGHRGSCANRFRWCRPGHRRRGERAAQSARRREELRTGAALHRPAPSPPRTYPTLSASSPRREQPPGHTSRRRPGPRRLDAASRSTFPGRSTTTRLRRRGPPSTPSSRASKSKLQSSHAPHLTCPSCRSGFPTGLRLLAG